jgi:hypothetical protein
MTPIYTGANTNKKNDTADFTKSFKLVHKREMGQYLELYTPQGLLHGKKSATA